MCAQPETSTRLAKLTRALAAGASTAAREYRLAREEQRHPQVAAADAPTSFATARSGLRRLPSAAGSRLLYLAFLAALPATLIALFNLGAIYRHTNWGAWLTIAAGAILLVIGVLLATNVVSARELLIAQLRPDRKPRRTGRVSLLARLTATALKLISVVWILLGLVALIRGSSNLH